MEEWSQFKIFWFLVVIDADGFRANVGIILCNDENRLFWGRRVGQNAWQFPQGGIRTDESPREAMYRELEEEVGLLPEHVEVLGETRRWYDIACLSDLVVAIPILCASGKSSVGFCCVLIAQIKRSVWINSASLSLMIGNGLITGNPLMK